MDEQRIVVAAGQAARHGDVAAVLPVRTTAGTLRFMCALRRDDGLAWVVLDDTGEPLRVPGEIRSAAETIADSICLGHPRNWRKALRAVRASGGAFVAVPDDAILEAMREAGRLAGVFGEPAGVAGLAGLRQAVRDGLVEHGQTALAVVTGSGLKDVRTAIRVAGTPFDLPADDAALADHLHERPV